MKQIKILVIVLSACFIACVIILAYLLGGSNEILCPDPIDIHCICDVSIDCCCPTESVTPTETSLPFSTPKQTVVSPTVSSTQSQEPSITITATRPLRPTRTPSDVPTITDAPPTKTPVIPTATIPYTPTVHTPTPVTCYQWLCHKPGTAAEQDYCCDSEGCIAAHLEHGDYLGKCRGE